MLKELIAIGMATTLMTAPPQNTNDGTYYQDVNITDTYEFETNEVANNDVDNLIAGNIYHFTFDITGFTNYNFIFDVSNYHHIDITSDTPSTYLSVKTTYTQFTLTNSENNATGTGADRIIFTFVDFTYDTTYYYGYRLNLSNGKNYHIEFDAVYHNYLNYSSKYDYKNLLTISKSEYLGEKTTTVEPVETDGLYNLAYHFLYSRIYTNTELQEMETTLFGTTINMNMWLSHTTAIVIICLLLVVLIKFVIWLFKIVSGGMLWK